MSGAISDLSAGGARVAGGTEGLAVGDELTLKLLFPLLDQQIERFGRVRHIEAGRGFGVEFDA